MTKPTQNEIYEALNKCMEAMDQGSRWPGMSYEQGVEAAIRWLTDDGPDPFDD